MDDSQVTIAEKLCHTKGTTKGFWTWIKHNGESY